MIFKSQKIGQSTIEYSTLVIIIIGVFLAAGSYVKRGIQGRWKSAVDDLGDQYDPRYSITDINYILVSNQETRIITVPTAKGVWTNRIDVTNSTEFKKGSSSVSAY